MKRALSNIYSVSNIIIDKFHLKFATITTIILCVFLAISLYLAISLFANLNTNTSDPSMTKWIDANLYWLYILLILAFVSIFTLEFVNAISIKRPTKRTWIVSGFILAIIGISYLYSDSEMPKFFGAEKFIEDGTVSPAILMWIGTGLIAAYILFAISVIAIAWSFIAKIFK